MALSNDTFYDLYEGLKHNFLFKNDLNSIHILLNLYDIEDNIRNIFPKYVSIKYLRNHISYNISYKMHTSAFSLIILSLFK